MALTRKLLESMGLDSDKVASIIEAHVETVDGLKEQIKSYKAAADELEGVQSELKTAKGELESLKSGDNDWQKKYNAEHEAFEKYKGEQTAKESLAEKSEAYKKLLKDSGVSEKRIDSILKLTDLKALELEGGTFKDAEKLTENIKSEWADFITTSNTQGATTTTPPENNGAKKFSHDEIAKMSPDEINANWDAIKDSMKG